MAKKKFKRQQWWIKRLGEKWRKPKGRQSKLRKQVKGRPKLPKIGFRKPKEERGKIKINDKLYEPVLIKNVNDLKKINPGKQIGIVASGVGKKKREEIAKEAEKLGVRLLNLKIKKKKKKKESEKK